MESGPPAAASRADRQTRGRSRGNGSPGRAGDGAATATGFAAPAAPSPVTVRRREPGRSPRWRRPAGWLDKAFGAVAERSYGILLGSWLAMVVAFGIFYWLVEWEGFVGMREGANPVPGTTGGLPTAIYFSFVTATSVGFGDVVPVGIVRFAAIIEAASGLLLFGLVIAKLVGRRQDWLLEETHRIAFEDRLGRVRTNLHLVLTELQSLSVLLAEGAQTPERLCPRMESAAIVFAGELRSIHDLLYRPQQAPDEVALESILASLGAALREFVELVGRLPRAGQTSPLLGSTIRGIQQLSEDICGECVPREYAPELKSGMDRVRELARALEPAARA